MKWLNRLAFAGAVLLAGLYLLSVILMMEVRGYAQVGLGAAQFDSLTKILNDTGIVVWPIDTSDPYTCSGASTKGGYYYNTSTDKFRLCDGSAWANWDSSVQAINDLTDVVITSVANNDHIVYDGVTDMRWENQAASASALNDLSDVNSPAPTNGYVLTWDSTPGEWVDTAASSASLAALTDTNISSPVLGHELFYDGTDSWDNYDTTMKTLFFPWRWENQTEGEGPIINADNQVRVFRFIVTNNINIDRIVWAVATVSDANCTQGAVGIYSLDGNTKLVDSGAQLYDTQDEYHNVDITNVFLNSGEYWLAYTATDASGSACTVLMIVDPNRVTVPNYEVLMNTGSTFTGTAANPSAAGVFPSTLGTITANEDIDRPIVKFIGT